MNTIAIELLTRSLNAGLTVTLNDSRLVVRGFPALRPLVDEINCQRLEITNILVEATNLLDETRAAKHVVIAIGTNRVSVATSIPGDLRERLRLAKSSLIAILRASTPIASQALNDLSGQPSLLSAETLPQTSVSPEYAAT